MSFEQVALGGFIKQAVNLITTHLAAIVSGIKISDVTNIIIFSLLYSLVASSGKEAKRAVSMTLLHC